VLYVPDHHPSAKGHGLIAKNIASFVYDRKNLTKPFAPDVRGLSINLIKRIKPDDHFGVALAAVSETFSLGEPQFQ